VAGFDVGATIHSNGNDAPCLLQSRQTTARDRRGMPRLRQFTSDALEMPSAIASARMAPLANGNDGTISSRPARNFPIRNRSACRSVIMGRHPADDGQPESTKREKSSPGAGVAGSFAESLAKCCGTFPQDERCGTVVWE